MNKLLTITTLTIFATAHLIAMDAHKLTFTAAQKGEDLAAYKAVLLKVYPEFAKDEAAKEAIKKLCETRFAIIVNWLGQSQYRFVKVQDGQKAIGFVTLEALDKENTRIAIHHSPLLPEYLGKAKDVLIQQVKSQFPQANVLYSAASPAAPKLHELIKSLGFEKDDSYKPNSELVPDSTEFVGYRRNI